MNESLWKGRRRKMVCSLVTFLSYDSDLAYISLSTATSDAALAARNQPRRMRAWENPKLRGKPPAKTLAAKTGEI
jgi:hypothetical protein